MSPQKYILLLFFTKKKIIFKDIVPKGYVDIHSHLLPGIDDGVKTVYKSAYIIEQFKALGFKKVITTPHVLQQVWPNTTAIIHEKTALVHETLNALDINNIEFSASAEYMLDDLFLERIKSNDLVLLPSKHILVEMSTFSAPMNLKDLLFEIKLAGITPVLAHPERYTFYHNSIEKYHQLKEDGFLLQLNLLSLSNYYGEQVATVAKKLLTQGLYDFAGTDIHNYYQLEVLEKGFDKNIAYQAQQLMEKNTFFS